MAALPGSHPKSSITNGAFLPHTFTFTPSVGREQCGFVSLSSKGGLNLPVQLSLPGVCVRLRVCQGLGAGALLGPEQPAPHPAVHTETQCWEAGGLGERMPRGKRLESFSGSSSCMKGWWGGTLMGKEGCINCSLSKGDSCFAVDALGLLCTPATEQGPSAPLGSRRMEARAGGG